MKIATWNCHMAFRKKAGLIQAHNLDILIVQECEHPGKLVFNPGVNQPTDIVWHGANRNKGLAVISYSGYKLTLLDIHNPEIKTILPVLITKQSKEYFLLAIWAFNAMDPSYKYVGQIWKALDYYHELLKRENVIIAGDFNSNVFWDKLKRRITHSMLVTRMTEMRIHSCYHFYNNIEQGKEIHPTYYMYRHKNKPYHIDYLFVSENLQSQVEEVSVGSAEEWLPISDHCPLIITLCD